MNHKSTFLSSDKLVNSINYGKYTSSEIKMIIEIALKRYAKEIHNEAMDEATAALKAVLGDGLKGKTIKVSLG